MNNYFIPLELNSLGRIEDRISFIFIDKSVINVENSAITVYNEFGVTKIPSAIIGVLILGPGTSISHKAICLLSDSGATVVWSDSGYTKLFASGRSLNGKSTFIEKQAKLFSNSKLHLLTAKKMYAKRFNDDLENIIKLDQLRGLEGKRMKEQYRINSERTSVPWKTRKYKIEDFDFSDRINRALTISSQLLYGICYTVIVSLGCSPSLGFIHVGTEKSFVYDIADFYKTNYSIPISFDVTRDYGEDTSDEEFDRILRQEMRKKINDNELLKVIVYDIKDILFDDEYLDLEVLFAKNVMGLWDGDDLTPYGLNYSRFDFKK